MAKPQQPEVRRSGFVPALDPDATEGKLSAQSPPESGDTIGDAPVEQQPGHRPAEDQDKPDLDAFAERLGVTPEGDEPRDAPNVTEAESAARNRWKPQWRRVLVPAAVAAGLVLAGVLRRRRS